MTNFIRRFLAKNENKRLHRSKLAPIMTNTSQRAEWGLEQKVMQEKQTLPFPVKVTQFTSYFKISKAFVFAFFVLTSFCTAISTDYIRTDSSFLQTRCLCSFCSPEIFAGKPQLPRQKAAWLTVCVCRVCYDAEPANPLHMFSYSLNRRCDGSIQYRKGAFSKFFSFSPSKRLNCYIWIFYFFVT